MSNLDYVISVCREDPYLMNLVDEHSYLLMSLKNSSLSSNEILSILEGAENDSIAFHSQIESEYNRYHMVIEDLTSKVVTQEMYQSKLNHVIFTENLKELESTLSNLSNIVKPNNKYELLEAKYNKLCLDYSRVLETFDIIRSENKSFEELEGEFERLKEEKEKIEREKEMWKELAESKTEPGFVLKKETWNLINFYNLFQKKILISKISCFQKLKKSEIVPPLQSEAIEVFKHKLDTLFSCLTNILHELGENKPLTLDLSTVEPSISSIQDLLESLSENSSLTELNLSNCNLKDSGAFELAEWLEKDEHLKTLVLRNNNFTPKGSSYIVSSIGLQGQITSLDLSMNDIEIETLTEFIQNTYQITDLYLENCKTTGDKFTELVEASMQSSLTGLYISYNPVSKEDFKILVEKLMTSPIRNFGFSGLGVGDDDLEGLKELFEHHYDMEVVHLAHLAFSSEGFEELMRALMRFCVYLQEIDVTGTTCSVKTVVELISSSSTIRNVVMREIDVSEEDYTGLFKAIEQADQLEVCLLDTKSN